MNVLINNAVVMLINPLSQQHLEYVITCYGTPRISYVILKRHQEGGVSYYVIIT